MSEGSPAGPSAGVRGLYPFLYAGRGDVDRVLGEVRRSTAEKAREIADLRDRVGREMAEDLTACAGAMARALAAGGAVLAFGNGGSSSDAQAVAQLFLHPPRGRPFPAMALTNDVAVVTALSNDVGFAVVFARQVAAFGRAGDVALGLSTSGSSENVLRGLEEAGRRGLVTVAFAGHGGGKMAESRAIEHRFVVPSSSVHRIQEAQTTLYHVLWELIQDALPGA